MEPHQPLDVAVTVVIALHNGARHITATLDSVEHQTGHVRCIVVDDRSTDDGPRIVAARAEGSTSLQLIANHRQPGPCGARNAGLEEVNTPWVLFLDHDDRLWPQATLELLAAATNGPPVAAVIGAFERIDTSGQVHDDRWITAAYPEGEVLGPPELIRSDRINPPGNTLYDTAIVRHLGGFDEGRLITASSSEDLELLLRVTGHGGARSCSGKVLSYLLHDAQRIQTRSALAAGWWRAVAHLLATRRQPPGTSLPVGLAVADRYRRTAAAHRAGRGARAALLVGADLGVAALGMAVGAVPRRRPWRPRWEPIRSGQRQGPTSIP